MDSHCHETSEKKGKCIVGKVNDTLMKANVENVAYASFEVSAKGQCHKYTEGNTKTH